MQAVNHELAVIENQANASNTLSEVLPSAVALPLPEQPAAVYLAGLSERSRRTMRGDLQAMAALLSGGRCAV